MTLGDPTRVVLARLEESIWVCSVEELSKLGREDYMLRRGEIVIFMGSVICDRRTRGSHHVHALIAQTSLGTMLVPFNAGYGAGGRSHEDDMKHVLRSFSMRLDILSDEPLVNGD